MKIYHNPRCSKSRQTLQLIEQADIKPEIILYMQDRLTMADISVLLDKLNFESPRQLLRKGEADYKALGLKNVDDEGLLIKAMVDFPKLMERPIVVKGDKAVLGRPPENVKALL